MVTQTQVNLLIRISVLTFQGNGDPESEALRKEGLY